MLALAIARGQPLMQLPVRLTIDSIDHASMQVLSEAHFALHETCHRSAVAFVQQLVWPLASEWAGYCR